MTRSNSMPKLFGVCVATFTFTYVLASNVQADRILLRSLVVINDRTVKEFDEDGVLLDDGKTITWDQIEQGSVDPAKQESFNKMLKDLGTHLYRIRQRLKVGDYEGLLEHAEALYPRYEDRRSPTAYMVLQSLMWARVANGQREKALEPYLRAFEYLRSTGTNNPDLPGTRRLAFDPPTALTPTLQPVWFDKEAAKTSLDGVRKAAGAMARPYPDGVYLYYASMASVAGETETATDMLGRVRGNQRALAELKKIVLAQQEVLDEQPGSDVSQLETTKNHMLPQNQAAAEYWLGLSKISQPDKETKLKGVLHLLRIPALHGKQAPELAGAGLHHAMTTLSELKDVKGSLAVRRELQVRYAHTSHAARLRTAASSKSNN